MPKSFNHKRFWRQFHYWGALACALPILVVIGSGLLLMLKKEIDWIQPPTVKTESRIPSLSFEKILAIASQVKEAEITSYDDIDRLDVRPGKGVIKIRARNEWEIQLHPQSGAILQVAYRRSEWIESLHDGSFFHNQAKLAVFLPAAIVLFVLWLTGIYLFVLPLLAKAKKKKRLQAKRV